jgi:hypothetical protein
MRKLQKMRAEQIERAEQKKKLTGSADANTQKLTTEGTVLGNFLGNLFSGPGGILPRIGGRLLAIVLIGAALWMP